MHVSVLFLYIMTYPYKNLLHAQNDYLVVKQCIQLMNNFFADTILGHTNALTNVSFLIKTNFSCFSTNFSLKLKKSSSSSSCRTISTDISDPLSPYLPIVHCFREATSRIGTELLYVGSSWTSYLCSAMWRRSTRVHHLWARPYFTSSVQHVWFV